MSTRSLTRRPGILLLILVSLNLLALSIQVKRGERTLLSNLTLTTLSPIISTAEKTFIMTREGFQAYIWQKDSAVRAERLKLDRAILLARLQEQERNAKENTELRSLLKIKPAEALDFIPARAFTQFGAPFKRYLLISVNDLDSVPEDTPIISPGGLVGRVTVKAGNLYKVMLITDPESAVGVSSRRTGINGVVQGDGAGLVIKWISNEANVKQGDIFETSGNDGVFPPGFPVCTVTSVKNGKDFTKKINAIPSSRMDRLNWVLLILRKDG